MNKSAEIAILSATIAQLGPQSYLGPWLESVRHELENYIRMDHFPRLSLAETAKEAAALAFEATARAQRITDAACQAQDQVRMECLRRREETDRDCAEAVNRYREQLYTARRALDSLLDR